MTISDTTTKYRYQGNAVTDTFAFSGKAFTAADLIVEIITRATDALVETLTLTTHYSVTIATDGTATIVTVAGKIPSALQDIQIRRALAKTQTTSLPVGTVFPAKLVENSIDRAVGITQDQKEELTRALKFRATSSTTVATLPEPTDDAVLCFDGSTGLFKVGATNTSLVAGAASAVINAAAAAASASTAAIKASEALISAAAAAASAASVTLPIIVTSGGTGLTTLTANNVILGNGTATPNFIAPSTSGNILTSNGTTWASTAPASSGALILITTLTASSSSSLVIDNTMITSTYNNYMFVLTDISASAGADFSVEYSTDNNSTVLSSGYLGAVSGQNSSGGTQDGASLTTKIKIGNGLASTASHGLSGTAFFYNPLGTTKRKVFVSSTGFFNNTGDFTQWIAHCTNTSTAAITALRFSMSTGTITSGTIKLYGVN